jgi:hypothetical protein
MATLLDIGLALMVLSGAFLLTTAALALVQELRKDNSSEKKSDPTDTK